MGKMENTMVNKVIGNIMESIALEEETKKPALQRYKHNNTTEVELRKWTDQRPTLANVKTGKDYVGLLLSDDGKFVAILQCNKTTGYIVKLEVATAYKNQNIIVELLNYAAKNLHCGKLTIRESNIEKINMYKQNGWRVFKKERTTIHMKR